MICQILIAPKPPQFRFTMVVQAVYRGRAGYPICYSLPCRIEEQIEYAGIRKEGDDMLLFVFLIKRRKAINHKSISPFSIIS